MYREACDYLSRKVVEGLTKTLVVVFLAAYTWRKSVTYHFSFHLYIDLMFPRSEKGCCIYSIDKTSINPPHLSGVAEAVNEYTNSDEVSDPTSSIGLDRTERFTQLFEGRQLTSIGNYSASEKT